jgi:transcriptional regulator with XRE-family HTH domain
MSEVSVLAKRLREARLQAGLSQRQLGIQAGIDEFSASARVNQYERGKHMPDLQTLTRLADVLKKPVPYFYCDDPDLAELIAKFASLSRNTHGHLLRFPIVTTWRELVMQFSGSTTGAADRYGRTDGGKVADVGENTGRSRL